MDGVKLMAGRNWSKFWWQDWQRDPALNLCSLEARGLWMDMLCIMADAEEKGVLTIGKTKVSSKELAQLSRISEKKCKKLIEELENNGVFSRDENGFIFSRRMVRDAGISRKSAENGKKGGNPALTQNDEKGLTPGLSEGLNPTRTKAEAEAYSEAESEAESRRTSAASCGEGDWVDANWLALGEEVLAASGREASRGFVDVGVVRQWLADARKIGYDYDAARETILAVIREKCEKGSGRGKVPKWFHAPVSETIRTGCVVTTATEQPVDARAIQDAYRDHVLWCSNHQQKRKPFELFEAEWRERHAA